MSSVTTIDAISRSAARLRWIVFGAMLAMALLYGAARLGLPLGQARVEIHVRGPTSVWSNAIGDITLALLMVALFRLTQLLRLIAAGQLFTPGVIGRFRSFAMWLLLMALFGLLAPPLAQLLGAAPTNHRIELRIDFRGILTVGVTLVLFLLARLLERAGRLDEEMREFV